MLNNLNISENYIRLLNVPYPFLDTHVKDVKSSNSNFGGKVGDCPKYYC